MSNASLLDLDVDYLISSFGATTATGLSNLLDGEVSYAQITRLLAGPAPTSTNLWLLVKPLVRQVENEEEGVIIDDRISHQPCTDENETICCGTIRAKLRFQIGPDRQRAIKIVKNRDLRTKSITVGSWPKSRLMTDSWGMGSMPLGKLPPTHRSESRTVLLSGLT